MSIYEELGSRRDNVLAVITSAVLRSNPELNVDTYLKKLLVYEFKFYIMLPFPQIYAQE